MLNLKALRNEKQLSAEDVAKKLNISVQAYYKYERNISEPNIESLIKLANYYQVSIDYLVDRKWQDEIGYLTPEQKLCVKLITKLNENNLAKVTGYISGIVDMQ